jgi:hypothetical protein
MREVGAGDQQYPPVGDSDLRVHLGSSSGTEANAVAGSAPLKAEPAPCSVSTIATTLTPRLTAEPRASRSGAYGLAEYVISNSSR